MSQSALSAFHVMGLRPLQKKIILTVMGLILDVRF